MTKKKSTNKIYFQYIKITVSILFIFLIALLIIKIAKSRSLNSHQNITVSPTQISDGDSFYTKITPTIEPANDSNYSIFYHPLNHFSFTYPSSWRLVMNKHNYVEDWYDIILTDENGKNSFRIYFEVNGRDYPRYEKQIEYKTLGNRNIEWTTLYDNGEAVEAFTNFPNNDFGNNLIGLYIYLPKENQEEFISQVEEIIASIQ